MHLKWCSSSAFRPIVRFRPASFVERDYCWVLLTTERSFSKLRTFVLRAPTPMDPSYIPKLQDYYAKHNVIPSYATIGSCGALALSHGFQIVLLN